MGEQNAHRDFAQEVTNCLACYRTLNENVNKAKEEWRFADIAEKITIDSFTLSSWQLHGTNSHFFLVGKDEQAKTAYLAFKGSETMQDIFTDLTVFSSMVQPQGITHAGIQKRADSIPVDPFIDLLFEEYKLIITGFSLGGGVAQLFTARLINHPQCRSKEWVNKLACITFGAPLVGDKEFGKLFNDEQSLWKELYHCFVNKDDIVVRLCSMADRQWQAITDITRTLCGVSFMHSNVAASIIKSLALDLFEKLVPRYYPFGIYYHVKDSKVERFDQHGLDDFFAIPTTGVDVRLEHIRNHLSYYEHFKVLLIQQEYGSLNKIQPKVFQMVEIDGENCTALSERENGVSVHLYGKNLTFVHTIIVNGYGIVDLNTSHGTKNNNHIGISNLQIRPQPTQITVILETHFGAIELLLRTITRTPLKDDTQRYDDLLLVEVLLATITRGLFEQPSSKMVQLTKFMEELLKKGSADDDIILSRYAAEMLLTEKLEDFNLENFTDNPKASLNAIIKELGGSNYTRDLREKISQALKAPHSVKITDPAKELPAFCYLEDIIALCQEKGKLDNHATSIFPLFYFLAIRLLRLLIQYNRKPTFFETIKKLLHKVSLVGFFRTLDLTIKIECCYQTRLTTLAQSLAIHIPNDIDGTALCSKLERNIYQHLGKHDIEYYMLNWRTIFKEPYSKVEEDGVKENIIAFIQCLQAIHEMRQELRNSFYVPIIGRKKAGKTTFIKYGFGIQRAEEGFDTIRPTMYEIDDTIPLRIVDFPGHEESGLIYKALNRLPLPTANTIVVFVEFESALAEQTLQILTDVEKYGASNYLICLNRFDQFCSNLKVSRTADQQPKEKFSIQKYLQQKNAAQSHTSSIESSPSNGTVVDLVLKEAVDRIKQYRKEIDLHLQAKADGGKAEIWVTSTSPDTKEVLFWQNALQKNGDGEQLRTSDDILSWIMDAYSKKTQN